MRIIHNIDMFFYNLKNGIKNIIRWTPVIWGDYDFDYNFLVKIMEWKLHKMSNYFKDNGHLVGSKKAAKEMLICSELLKRINEDNLGENGITFKQHELRMKGWLEMLGNLMSQKLRFWWD